MKTQEGGEQKGKTLDKGCCRLIENVPQKHPPLLKVQLNYCRPLPGEYTYFQNLLFIHLKFISTN